MLQIGVSMGAEVTNLHRKIKFMQDYFFSDYIDPGTEMRANTKTEPEKITFKLLNNGLFGKTCENPLKHIRAKILTDESEIGIQSNI